MSEASENQAVNSILHGKTDGERVNEYYTVVSTVMRWDETGMHRKHCGYGVSNAGQYEVVALEDAEKWYMEKEAECKSQNRNFVLTNAVLQNDALVGTQGLLVNYPMVDEKNNVLNFDKGMILAALLVENDTGIERRVGGIVYTSQGEMYVYTLNDIKKMASSFRPVNFSIKGFKSAGQQPIIEILTVQGEMQTAQAYNSLEGEIETDIVDKRNIDKFSMLEFQDFDDMDLYYDVNRKFTEAKLNMQNISPYYATILNGLEIIPVEDGTPESEHIKTFAVTENKMYFNYNFMSGLKVGEITFILMHEMNHIIMQHAFRSMGKNATLWNIATDMYINSTICNDYNVHYMGGAKKVHGKFNDGIIETPKMGIFPETLAMSIDLGGMTAEDIYAKLLEDNPDLESFNPIFIDEIDNSNAQMGGGSMPGGSMGQEQDIRELTKRFSDAIESIKDNLTILGTSITEDGLDEDVDDFEDAMFEVSDSCENLIKDITNGKGLYVS